MRAQSSKLAPSDSGPGPHGGRVTLGPGWPALDDRGLRLQEGRCAGASGEVQGALRAVPGDGQAVQPVAPARGPARAPALPPSSQLALHLGVRRGHLGHELRQKTLPPPALPALTPPSILSGAGMSLGRGRTGRGAWWSELAGGTQTVQGPGRWDRETTDTGCGLHPTGAGALGAGRGPSGCPRSPPLYVGPRPERAYLAVEEAVEHSHHQALRTRGCVRGSAHRLGGAGVGRTGAGHPPHAPGRTPRTAQTGSGTWRRCRWETQRTPCSGRQTEG